jgi:hypothetical protein
MPESLINQKESIDLRHRTVANLLPTWVVKSGDAAKAPKVVIASEAKQSCCREIATPAFGLLAMTSFRLMFILSINP